MKNVPWHTKATVALILFTPLYFMIAALGTKIGLWGWQFGLGTLTGMGGLVVLGLLALVAIVSLIICVRKDPRPKGGIIAAGIGLLVPALAAVMIATAMGKASMNPIHDVSTDTANPPVFSAQTMSMRTESEANPVADYQVPLSELPDFEGVEPKLAIKSHAQIVNDIYAGLSPLPLGGASKADAVAAVAAAMNTMGMNNIRSDVQTGIVEGVAETFWFGFKDDVVARVGENEIDFRSVSRVGRSDLGANAARITELRELVAQQIGQR